MSPNDLIVDLVKLSRPAQRALSGARIMTFADLANWRRQDVAALHGIGPTALAVLDPALAARGLDWRTL